MKNEIDILFNGVIRTSRGVSRLVQLFLLTASHPIKLFKNGKLIYVNVYILPVAVQFGFRYI